MKRRISTSTLLRIGKKMCNMKMTIILIVIGALGTVNKWLLKELEGLEIKGRVEENPNHYIILNGQNTEKSHWDLMILAIIQTSEKDHQRELMWKKSQGKRIRRARRRPKSWNKHRFSQNDSKKISTCKTPGPDGIHGFWFKKFPSIYDRLALKMNRCLQGAHVLEWWTKGKTTLIEKNLMP